MEYKLVHPLTWAVGNAMVGLSSDIEFVGEASGVNGVGGKSRDKQESMTRRRWCMGVSTCERISVLSSECASQRSNLHTKQLVTH
jgi:hypothetical protein